MDHGGLEVLATKNHLGCKSHIRSLWFEKTVLHSSNYVTLDFRDCDDKALLKEEDRKLSKIRGISGMGR